MERKYIKLLQFLLGMPASELDGYWGPKTQAAADALIKALEQVIK